MLLEALELRVWLEQGIAVVEPDDVTDIPDVVGHRVDEAASKGLRRQRKPKRVDHLPGRDGSLGHLPQLFDAQRIDLRILAGAQIELAVELLGKRAAWPFA